MRILQVSFVLTALLAGIALAGGQRTSVALPSSGALPPGLPWPANSCVDVKASCSPTGGAVLCGRQAHSWFRRRRLRHLIGRWAAVGSR